MSEEEKVNGEETPAATPAAETAEGGDDEGKKKFRNKQDEVPIEDLYDLSKPIPRVRTRID